MGSARKTISAYNKHRNYHSAALLKKSSTCRSCNELRWIQNIVLFHYFSEMCGILLFRVIVFYVDYLL